MMGVATGYTADHMGIIEAACIVSGVVSSDHLILTRQDGSTIDAGNVRGPQGIQGIKGDTGSQGPGNATDSQVATFINQPASASQAAVDARVQATRTTTDWNTEKTAGYVYGANTALNSPGSSAWVGRVMCLDTSTVIQEVWKLNTAIAPPEMWYRIFFSGAWQNWVQVIGDTGWTALPLVSTATTPGLAGLLEYRVVNRVFNIRTHTVTMTSQAQGATFTLCAAGAIPVALRPSTAMLFHNVSGNAVGYMAVNIDGSVTARASTAAATSVTSFGSYPIE
jgi:hypothetical protein